MADIWGMTVPGGRKHEGESMHSHDRTMIAKLGFADDDRRNTEHDLACRYLMEEETAGRIARAIVVPGFESRLKYRVHELQKYRRADLEKSDPPTYRDVRAGEICLDVCGSTTEVPLMKGEGQYATTLGFLDVRINFYIQSLIYGEQIQIGHKYDTPDGSWQSGAKPIRVVGWKDARETFDQEGLITIEVKIGEVGIGEAIRQIKFYRSFIKRERDTANYFVLATRYEVSEQEAAILENENIHHIHLGEGFTAWMEAARKEASPSKTSIRL